MEEHLQSKRQQAASSNRRVKSPCDHTVAQNQLPRSWISQFRIEGSTVVGMVHADPHVALQAVAGIVSLDLLFSGVVQGKYKTGKKMHGIRGWGMGDAFHCVCAPLLLEPISCGPSKHTDTVYVSGSCSVAAHSSVLGRGRGGGGGIQKALRNGYPEHPGRSVLCLMPYLIHSHLPWPHTNLL